MTISTARPRFRAKNGNRIFIQRYDDGRNHYVITRPDGSLLAHAEGGVDALVSQWSRISTDDAFLQVEGLEFKNPSSAQSEQGGVSGASLTSPSQSDEAPGSSGQAGTVEDDGSRTGGGQDFSLSSRSALDRISATLAARIRRPEQREAFFKLAKDRLRALREDSLNWRHDVREGLDSLADRDRTAASLETERKFRFRSRQRELIEQGMAGLSRETMDALYSDDALGDAREDPLIAEMLVRDAKAVGGWRGRLRSYSQADERTHNEYDDMPEGLPRWMFGGSMAPDQLAQELYDNGMTVAPTPTGPCGRRWSARSSPRSTSRNSSGRRGSPSPRSSVTPKCRPSARLTRGTRRRNPACPRPTKK